MEGRPAFHREGEFFVPPERVMTRLMSRPSSPSRDLWLGYLLLGTFIAGIVVGLFLAGRM